MRILYNSFLLFVSPKEFVLKTIDKIFGWIDLWKYDQTKTILKQEQFYKQLELDRSLGIKVLSDLKLSQNKEHHILFASISIEKNISSILEIGTFDGKNAALLSCIFPNASILTIDLPKNDPIFCSTYNRNNSEIREKFLARRNETLAKHPNVKFEAINSLELTLRNEKFDLIWVDGAHGFPVVAIDIANSIRLLKQNGKILCDDMWINRKSNDSIYKSNGTYETLEAFKHASLIDYSLIFKRLNFESSGLRSSREYISIVKKK